MLPHACSEYGKQHLHWETANQKAARLLGKTVLRNITTKAQSENMLYQIR
jgi:hypothetical protein